MTQAELDRQIAKATGESLRQIRRQGFSLADPDEVHFDPEPSQIKPQWIDWDAVYAVEPVRSNAAHADRPRLNRLACTAFHPLPFLKNTFPQQGANYARTHGHRKRRIGKTASRNGSTNESKQSWRPNPVSWIASSVMPGSGPWSSLGLADWQAELDNIEKQKEALERRYNQVRRAMLAHVRGVPIEDVDEAPYKYHCTNEVDSAVDRRRKVHEDELLAESEIGREILRLRQEQDNLLDTVWLATSPTQLKTLWLKVNQLLANEPSQLERDALEIEPIDGLKWDSMEEVPIPPVDRVPRGPRCGFARHPGRPGCRFLSALFGSTCHKEQSL